jgi:hypothetical protein
MNLTVALSPDPIQLVTSTIETSTIITSTIVALTVINLNLITSVYILYPPVIIAPITTISLGMSPTINHAASVTTPSVVAPPLHTRYIPFTD